MVLESTKTPKTNFQEEYDRLSPKDKQRVKNNIENTCEIGYVTFYQWLKNPALISKNDRYFIAETVFGKSVKELFND